MTNTAVLLDWFETALLTRRFEQRMMALGNEGVLPPMLHPGAGHEIGQIAAIAALRDDDPLIYSHRGLAYMVARGVPLAAMLADIAGRVGGTNNGKGGIMHVVDTARGIYGESGTLGGGLVIATGMAMALQKQRKPQVVAHFFGDGGSNRGTFHESLNWAAVMKLPCLFICENNGWAVSVPTSVSTAVADIASRAAGYGIPGVIVDGGDPDAVYDVVTQAARRARAGEGPSLIEIKMTRLLGHYSTDPQDYRPDADTISASDPLERLRARLETAGCLNPATLAAIEREITAQIDDAVSILNAAVPLDPATAFSDLYAGQY